MTGGIPEHTILVTGGRGRLGRLLVRDLRERGSRVVSLGRTRPDVHHDDEIVIDLRDAGAVADLARRVEPEIIVHLASVLHGDDLVVQNRLIDSAVVGAAREARIGRVVHASSGAVYGTTATEARREDSALAGDSPYATSKIAGEELFRRLAADRPEAAVTTLRIFNIAGPSFPDSLVYKLVHATPAAPATVLAPDHFVRDYIHQGDVVSVLRAAADAEHSGHRVINVGAGAAVSTRVLLDRLQVEDSRVIVKDGGPSTNWADVSRMVDELGVVPSRIPTLAWESATLSD